MIAPRLAVVSWIGALALGATGRAQDLAPWLLVRRLQIDGNSTFPTSEIRGALASSLVVLDGLTHALDDAARRDLLAQQVLEGYRGAGFVDAAVRAETVDGTPTLHVIEGPRCRTGAVVVTGTVELPAAELTARLQRKNRPWQGWQAEHARCDIQTAKLARSQVDQAYAAIGRYGIDADLRFVRKGDVVDLAVTLRDEGHLVRAGRLEIVGEQPEDLAAVLARVRIA